MLFIHPMWDSETQRLGKRACTPVGYALHGIAELVGFVGLVALPVSAVVLAWKGLTHGFDRHLLKILAWPFGLGVVSEVLFQLSWWFAVRKEFRCDEANKEASWMERGERRTYRWSGRSTR